MQELSAFQLRAIVLMPRINDAKFSTVFSPASVF